MLSDAHAAGQLLTVRCGHCRTTRHYLPGDVITVLGDVGLYGIVGRMRCEKCGDREWLSASFSMPSARERQGMRVRRLAKVETVRKVVWRDE